MGELVNVQLDLKLVNVCVIIIAIISEAQILEKPSALYKEHGGRWGSWLSTA